MKKLLLLTLFIISTSIHADSSKITFSDGWIKQLPPVVPVRAGYIKIDNPSDVEVEITSLHSDVFEAVEMHETTMEAGMMKMAELFSVKLPAKSKVELKPGAKHIMFITPKFPLAIGDSVKMTVTFSDQKTQVVNFEVKK